MSVFTQMGLTLLCVATYSKGYSGGTGGDSLAPEFAITVVSFRAKIRYPQTMYRVYSDVLKIYKLQSWHI